MPHSRSSSGQSAHDTGFPEQFAGTTQRHPEARVLRSPWEPKEVDMVRRARQLSMMRNQSLQARQFGVDDDDDDDELDLPRFPISPRKRTTFPASRNSPSFFQTTLAVPALPSGGGHPLQRPVSHEGGSSPTGSSGYTTGDELGRPITADQRSGTGGHALGQAHSMGHNMGHSHSHSQSSTDGYEYHHDHWAANPHATISASDRSGWGAWAAKFGEWRRKRSRSNSFRS